MNHHHAVPFHLLRDVPAIACGEPGEGNLIVQGDNLVALKALLPYYAGRVKCIFIDPPYNTGNEGWAYNDNVNSPEIRAWLGKVVGKEGETLDRHDRWLCMMYPRLALLRQFLREDGVIFVTLDDIELANFRLMADAIFGIFNFVGNVLWQKRTSPDARLILSDAHDHVICYALKKERLVFSKVPQTERQIKAYKNPDNDPRGAWVSSDYAAQGFRPNQMYEITTPSGRRVNPPQGSCWKNVESVFLELVADKRIWFGKDGDGVPRRKTFLGESEGVSVWTWWSNEEVGHSQEAKKELQDIFGGIAPFETPKPTRLLERILQIATQPGDLILDSFAGSGTTAHAVLKLNAAQPEQPPRHCILVEMDEKIAREVTAERMRRVAKGYTNPKGEAVAGLGGGFRFCELGEPLYDEAGHIRASVKFAELARHIYFAETGEPLPRERVAATPLLGVHKGRAVCLLYNGILKDKSPEGGNALTHDSLALLREAAAGHAFERMVVYGTSRRLSPARLQREGITFKQIPYTLRTA